MTGSHASAELVRSRSGWADDVRALEARGIRIALPHRPEGRRISRASDTWRLRILADDVLVDSFGVEVYRSRVLPGHARLRVRCFCPGVGVCDAADAAVRALRETAMHRGVLSVHVEVLALHGERRDAIEGALARAGFRAVRRPRRYPQTVVVDLARDSTAILASFHPTARRHIRAAHRSPLRIAPIADTVFGARLEELARESFRRRSAVPGPRDWAALVGLAGERPDLARVVGIFRDRDANPNALLAFAAGLHHGDHAEYDSAGSTRPNDVKTPLGYALAWDLMEWARALGGRWFDFGGVTAGSHGDPGDELGGISDFKRYFTETRVEVGGEWALESRPLRSLLAGSLGRAAAAFRLRRRRPGRDRPAPPAQVDG
jgi:hypothetical protein